MPISVAYDKAMLMLSVREAAASMYSVLCEFALACAVFPFSHQCRDRAACGVHMCRTWLVELNAGREAVALSTLAQGTYYLSSHVAACLFDFVVHIRT
jgi:hypothetical protein